MTRTATLSVLVRNHFGVLTKVSSHFGKRGLNIHSLTVFPTANGDESLITIVADVADGTAEKMTHVYNQLEKLEDVKSIGWLEEAREKTQ